MNVLIVVFLPECPVNSIFEDEETKLLEKGETDSFVKKIMNFLEEKFGNLNKNFVSL